MTNKYKHGTCIFARRIEMTDESRLVIHEKEAIKWIFYSYVITEQVFGICILASAYNMKDCNNFRKLS